METLNESFNTAIRAIRRAQFRFEVLGRKEGRGYRTVRVRTKGAARRKAAEWVAAGMVVDIFRADRDGRGPWVEVIGLEAA